MASFRQRVLMRLVNVYPPYLGAGIRVIKSGDPYAIRVRMKLTFYNRNLFGTHFGGSLYAMCDPFFVFLLLRHLGDGYLVWNKAAAVDFVKPGRGTVTAEFHVAPERVAEIRAAADRGEKVEPVFSAEVVDAGGEVVARVTARVTERLWVKRKASPLA